MQMNMSSTENSYNIRSTITKLAKLLASENINLEVSQNAKTAYFDLKNRMLTLPAWNNISKHLLHMLIVHEVGHAIDTPHAIQFVQTIEDTALKIHSLYPNKNPKDLKDSLKGFFNVIEDARIDKRQKRRYPGSIHDYNHGYEELFDRDFFGLQKKSFESLNFIDRFNLYFKGGISRNILFNKKEYEFVERAFKLETWEEVVSLTTEIFLWSIENENNLNKEPHEISVAQEVFVYEEDFGENGKNFNTENTKGETDNDAEENSNVEGNNTKKQKKNAKSTKETKNDNFIPKATIDEYFSENLKKLVEETQKIGVEIVQTTLPKPLLQNIIMSHKDLYNGLFDEKNDSAYFCWRNNENNTISFMVNEFEQKKAAKEYAKKQYAKTGILNTNKVFSYKFNDDIFKKNLIEHKGKNHGFVMFIDFSGSMAGNIKKTLRQVMSLVLFCKRIQVPFEVYGFTDSSINTRENFQQTDSKNCITFYNNFVIYEILNSKMTNSEFLFAMKNLLHSDSLFRRIRLCGTPLNEAILAASHIVNNFKEKTKIDIVNVVFLTDGDSRPIQNFGVKTEDIFQASVIIKDPETNKLYASQNKKSYYFLGNEITTTFLKILKDRTNCNLIGFFLTDSFQEISRSYLYIPGTKYENIKKEDYEKLTLQWREKRGIYLTDVGYDELYCISTNQANKSYVNQKNDTLKDMIKQNKSKKTNRYLLNRFIEKNSA